MKVVMHPEKGRVLVTTMDYKAGDIILSDSPLFIRSVEPTLVWDLLNTLASEQEMNGEEHPFQPVWFYVGLQSCVVESEAPGAARELLELAGIKLNEGWRRDAMSLLFVSDQEFEEFATSPIFDFARKFKQRLADELFALTENYTHDSIKHLLDACFDLRSWLQISYVWVYNCFQWSTDESEYEGLVIYFIASFPSHSCAPNMVGDIDDDTGVQVMRARRDIACGEEVTISYLTEESLLLPAAVRRSDLLASKRFFCLCERCSLNGDRSRCVRCYKCRLGFRLMGSDSGWCTEWYSGINGPNLPYANTLVDGATAVEPYLELHLDDKGRHADTSCYRLANWLTKTMKVEDREHPQPKHMISDPKWLDKIHDLVMDESDLLQTACPWLAAWSLESQECDDENIELKPKSVDKKCCDEDQVASRCSRLPVMPESIENILLCLNHHPMDASTCSYVCNRDQCTATNVSSDQHEERKNLRAEKHMLMISCALNQDDILLDGWQENFPGHVTWQEVWPNRESPPGLHLLQWIAEERSEDRYPSSPPPWVKRDIVELVEICMNDYTWTYACKNPDSIFQLFSICTVRISTGLQFYELQCQFCYCCCFRNRAIYWSMREFISHSHLPILISISI
eukprot:GHVH01008154.1.p1 GENE.GHVH01008154.1~~GHVH01008154.1.p1  ORF type:complete len:627 (-),score=64.90 GHVH01008154.1:147-2027(-)